MTKSVGWEARKKNPERRGKEGGGVRGVPPPRSRMPSPLELVTFALHDRFDAGGLRFATFEFLDAQVQRYEGVEVTNEKGESKTPIHNDMEALHALSATSQVDLAGRIALNKQGEEVFNFGKHQGKKVAEVLAKEPSYYDWMLKSEFPLDTKRKLTEIRLRSLSQR
mgnify:CR=1 FL=1